MDELIKHHTCNWHLIITDNYITVNRNKLDLYEAIQWAKKHCSHYITNQYHGNHHGNDLIDFFFLDQPEARKEMNWFILRWS
jgi:hypothetical protein